MRQARLDSIAADRTRFPDQGAWAALARLALDVHEGRFDEGAAAVRAFLAGTGDGARKPSPVEQNQLRYLAAIEDCLLSDRFTTETTGGAKLTYDVKLVNSEFDEFDGGVVFCAVTARMYFRTSRTDTSTGQLITLQTEEL